MRPDADAAAPRIPTPRGNRVRREAFLAACRSERAAIHEDVAAPKAEALEARRQLGRREFPVIGRDFPGNAEAIRLATSPPLLAAAVHIDRDSGPLHVLEADASREILDAFDYRNIDRISDREIEDRVGWDVVTSCCGPAGTDFLADTTRCLHFGGRRRKPGKPVRHHRVFQYLLPTSFLFPIARDCEHPRHLPNLEPARDNYWDALIGARFT